MDIKTKINVSQSRLFEAQSRIGLFDFAEIWNFCKTIVFYFVTKSYLFSGDVGQKEKFEFPKGLKDISFKILKKPINIERYLEPVDDEDGMEHYSKNI